MTSRLGFIGVSCTRFHSSPLSSLTICLALAAETIPRSTRYVNSSPPACSNCPNYSRANACIHSPFALGPNPFLGMQAYHGLGLRSHPLQFANASLSFWESDQNMQTLTGAVLIRGAYNCALTSPTTFLHCTPASSGAVPPRILRWTWPSHTQPRCIQEKACA